MNRVTLYLLLAVVAVALAEGQYYVPRAYYTIDAEGHASLPVPLRRLRRSLSPFPRIARAAKAEAPSFDSDASAAARAYSQGVYGSGAWVQPNAGPTFGH